MPHNLYDAYQGFSHGRFYSLPQLEKRGVGPVSTLPVSIRIVLESVLRNCDGRKVREEDVVALSRWEADGPRTGEIPFTVARVLLQDFTGVPLLADLAAMRAAAERAGRDPGTIEPLVPVDLVIDHSVQVDSWGGARALEENLEIEFRRNRERYEFLKWGTQAFESFRVIPPGIGIVHQVNLEYLAKGVVEKGGVYFPDTLVGTDSHTTMINGLGIVGWGVGGIEAEAAMLGQPLCFATPDVIGVHLTGSLREGVTATDAVLTVTEMLRKAKVVGKFVEFHGEGAARLPLTDRATIANMAPEYGATMGYFPVDEETCRYLLATGRPAAHVDAFRAYFEAQGMFGIPRGGQCRYTRVLELDLGSIRPSVAGPRRPQDRIELPELEGKLGALLESPVPEGGYGRSRGQTAQRQAVRIARSETPVELGDGDVVIAAITSCTNTSNPSVMLAAGLVAKKAVERGLRVPPWVKTSLAPGSRVVTEYLERTGLLRSLEAIGFHLVGYGCTTCIGNSGPIDPGIEAAIGEHGLVLASVLSGNRNFEARVHPAVKANFLMSPPLVVAFALAGRAGIDLTNAPVGRGSDGRDVFLRDLWPSLAEIAALAPEAMDPDSYRRLYTGFADRNPLWNAIPSAEGRTYRWDPRSTYIREPGFFGGFSQAPSPPGPVRGARALALFGDSVTTDHISPAGSIKKDSPAGRYLLDHGVPFEDFNSYGSRRGNHEVMIRGTFGNVRIRNLLLPGVEGGFTLFQPGGERTTIYEASLRYRAAGVPLVVFAGQEYGTGSSRDWAAKGTTLLGVRAVIARSFERIHRSNLVGMGVLPLELPEGTGPSDLGIDGTETFDIEGMEGAIRPRQALRLVIHPASGESREVPLTLRIDTPVEVDYYLHGGILPYVLRQLLSAPGNPA